MVTIGKMVFKKTRLRVIKTGKWSGKLIEPKYTKNISSSIIKNKLLKSKNFPQNRTSLLKRLIESKEKSEL